MSSEPGDEERARSHLESTREALSGIDPAAVARVVAVLRQARGSGATVYVIGNGGSASTASHLATDLSKATARDGAKRLRAISLSDNAAFLTALANDDGYDQVFAGQLSGLVRAGDVLIAISASGNSANVLRAVELARGRGATTVALVGFDGGDLLRLADVAVHVATEHGAYGTVEDAHLAIHHALTVCLAHA